MPLASASPPALATSLKHSEAVTLRLLNVVKLFAGQSRPAVDGLSLDVPAGQVCVLVGPSGCGKTTALRMINRLVEPTSGEVMIGDTSAGSLDPPSLRRRIGYVIQHAGLLPHQSIATNVATVPRLLKWEPDRIDDRVKEMLALVGLPEAEYGMRYPHELSGGQQQRVGLARALAADPPLMLMDEPFSAVDPITRTRLQDDFLALQRRLAKTVVFVTHDIDEAVKMADQVAVMREGHLVQYATPAELLAKPEDGFVEDFVGADRALKRLALIRIAEVEMDGTIGVSGGVVVTLETSVRTALSMMLDVGAIDATVQDTSGRALGRVSMATLTRVASTVGRGA
jgi:osmoprotectant transport system ATP-binding protein